MPLSAQDHLEAVRQQLIRQRDELDHLYKSERARIDDLIRALGEAPDVLSRKLPLTRFDKPVSAFAQVKAGKRHETKNENIISPTVRAYVMHYEYNDPLKVRTIIDVLRERGAVGERKNLDSQVRAVLLKIVDKEPETLKFVKGEGFFKPHGKSRDTQLVYSDEGGRAVMDRRYQEG